MAGALRERLGRSLQVLRRDAVSAIRMDPLGGSPHLRPLPIFELTRPSDLEDVIIGCDADIGGLSNVQLGIAAEPGGPEPGGSGSVKGKGVFKGVLRKEVTEAARRSGRLASGGYAAFRTRSRKTLMGDELWDVEAHRYLRLRIRSSGDDMRYFVNIQTTSPVKVDLYQHRLWPSKVGEWEDVLIPFADFALTNNGRICSTQIPMARDAVRSVGLSVVEKEGPFELGVERVDCVSDQADSPS